MTFPLIILAAVLCHHLAMPASEPLIFKFIILLGWHNKFSFDSNETAWFGRKTIENGEEFDDDQECGMYMRMKKKRNL